jgi:hypothetical protein
VDPDSANHVRHNWDELIHVPDRRLLVGVSARLLCSLLLRYGALWLVWGTSLVPCVRESKFSGIYNSNIPLFCFFRLHLLIVCGVELAVYFPAKISAPRECR